ncbi:MAG: histone deacetylase, partial [Myxococcota bacterium]
MSRTVAVVPTEPFLAHVEPNGHPERRARLVAVRDALAPVEGLMALTVNPATDEQLAAVHPMHHIRRVRERAQSGGGSFDPDTYVGTDSEHVAALAAGALCHAVDVVVGGDADTAWNLARPPGHHATADVSMGFCLYNSVAVAARHAQRCHGVERVLIIDW